MNGHLADMDLSIDRQDDRHVFRVKLADEHHIRVDERIAGDKILMVKESTIKIILNISATIESSLKKSVLTRKASRRRASTRSSSPDHSTKLHRWDQRTIDSDRQIVWIRIELSCFLGPLQRSSCC